MNPYLAEFLRNARKPRRRFGQQVTLCERDPRRPCAVVYYKRVCDEYEHKRCPRRERGE
jgi:hypothetical protein